MSEVDYIIVGAGSAGCVLANQLSEDAGSRVLLLEAGRDESGFVVKMPKGIGKLLFDTTLVRRFDTEPEEASGGESESWPRGRMLGGSSRINGMFYTRGQPQDYDDWAANGAPGWGWNEIGPCFRRLEDHELGDDGVRGVGGPLHVSCHSYPNPLCDAFIQSAGKLGLEAREDINRPDQEGIGYITLNIKDGVRVDAASAFIDPIRNRSNLEIHTECFVERILFSGRRATGVRCMHNGERKDYFGKEVILCGGAIQSPQLLQLSGVGSGDHLRRLGIEVVADLPGVGANLREHRFISVQYRLNRPLSLNRQFSGVRLLYNVLRYVFTRKGVMATGPHDVVGFARTIPELQRPDIEVMMAPFSTAPGKVNVEFEKQHGIQVIGYQLRPESQGSVMIQSADPSVDPVIRPNYLTEEEDRLISGRILRYLRTLCAQDPIASYITEEISPGPSVQTEEEAIAYNKATGCPVMHPAGTCRMGQDDLAVVDPQCNVRGIEGLRIVDCSIMPSLVSGHTNGPVMAMALRAADIIRGS